MGGEISGRLDRKFLMQFGLIDQMEEERSTTGAHESEVEDQAGRRIFSFYFVLGLGQGA